MYLRKSYLYNSIMKDVSYSLKQILDETLGSLYLNDKEKSIVDKIFNDIDTEKYKNNKLSYKDYQQIADSSDTLYNLQYDNILPWLEHLEIIIIENDSYNSTNAAALLDYDNYTTFSNEKIIYATIVIINPHRERFTKNKITHELNHYYSEFNRYKKTKLYPVYSDIDINVNYQHYNIDFSNIELAKFQATTNNAYLKSILMECLYWLNESEIKAHIEDIYYELEQNLNKNICKNINDISKYSETLQYYMNIDKLLNITYKNLTVEQKQYLNRTLIPLFNLNRTFNKNKRLNIDYVYKKMFNKIKKIYKHIHRMYVYLHEL